MPPKSTIHPAGCNCEKCTGPAGIRPRGTACVRSGLRLVLLLAAICAIPFLIAAAIASGAGDRR